MHFGRPSGSEDSTADRGQMPHLAQRLADKYPETYLSVHSMTDLARLYGVVTQLVTLRLLDWFHIVDIKT